MATSASPLPKSFKLRAAGGKNIEMPSVGFGTWASGEASWAKQATATALKEGYTHIDGAWLYAVDKPVGEAIRESGVPREQIFYTSKAWPNFLTPEAVELCLDKVLEETGLDYVDLFLAHWPVAWESPSHDALKSAVATQSASNEAKGFVYKDGKPVVDWKHTSGPLARRAGHEGSFVATWKAMQELVRKGKARAIGVSNFDIAGLEELLQHEDDVPLSCHQIEVHPWLPQKELVEFGHKHGIVTTCYSPFAGQNNDGQKLTDDKTVVEIARKNGLDVGQVLQSWAVQRGTVPLGKSATAERIRSNLQVKRLSEEDVKALDGLEKKVEEGRTVNLGKRWGIPIF